jgi:hypothetical protein
LGCAGASKHLAPEFSILPQVFIESPSPAPTPTPTAAIVVSGVAPPLSPCNIPLGAKPVGKRTIPGNSELSVFNILNIFCHHWFLSVDHLRANALSAQKAESGKIFWIKFAPQFHSHLVKCTVALVPHPLLKVKKVMFVYILELLNQEGHQAFFDLMKGTRIATQVQKEKKHLAWKRTCTARRESWKATDEAAQGQPHWQCKLCGHKFTTCKAKKQHCCPISKEVSSKTGTDKGKGNANALSWPNKPAPSQEVLCPL